MVIKILRNKMYIRDGSSTYQQESVDQILKELRADQEHYQHLYKRYKKCFRILLFLEFLFHSANVACQSSALVSLLTVTAPIGLIFNSVGVVTSGLSVFCRQLSHRKSKLLMKNNEFLKLSKHVERTIISQCMNDNEVSAEDYNLAMKIIESYYQQRDAL